MRGDRIPVHRITPEQQFVNRVVGESIGVVRIGMAASEPVDALRQRILKRMPHVPRLSIIDEASGEAIDQLVPRFRRFQHHRTAVGARVRLIERRDEGFVEEVGEEDSLWYRVVAQSKASVVGKSSCGNGFVPCGGFCVSIEIGPFVNYPG